MDFCSDAGNVLKEHLEYLLFTKFENLGIADSFLLYVFIKHPDIVKMFDKDSLPF